MMVTFDMRLAMDQVCNLKRAICDATRIPEDKQVLLVSGGQSLNNFQKVCSYSAAGTETSPIFLFAKHNIESNQPPVIVAGDYGNVQDMTEIIESCMSMQPSLDTLVARTELAADLNRQAIKQNEICERLVHDQHLQQQGWAAVVANLEDLTRGFRNKAEMLTLLFNEFIKSKPKYKELLNKLGDDIKHLHNILVLPTLVENNSKSSSPTSETTLSQWIDRHDSDNSLERLVELCWLGLERFTEDNSNQLRQEVSELLKSASNSTMKEIKGLEERLFGLEKLLVDSRKFVDEQGQLASSFQNNRERFSKIKDHSLLPDLSASHKQQLQMMLKNHKKMEEFRDRCLRAKHELSVTLHGRLKWIVYIEQQISDLDGKLMIYKENLQRLGRYFDAADQVHQAPELYLEAVVETLRRRQFSRRYLHWANSVAKISQGLYENEMELRRSFDSKLGDHFLSALFPGLIRAHPPPFATSPPDPFDTELPRITAADIQHLQTSLCDELASKLKVTEDITRPHTICVPAVDSVDSKSIKDPTESTSDEILDGTGGDENADANSDLDDRHSLNPTPPSSPNRSVHLND